VNLAKLARFVVNFCRLIQSWCEANVPEDPIKEHVSDIIRLLIGLREPSLPFEREIRLYELQTWVYFPDMASAIQEEHQARGRENPCADMPRAAVLLAAARAH
jgi:hypothetical protein